MGMGAQHPSTSTLVDKTSLMKSAGPIRQAGHEIGQGTSSVRTQGPERVLEKQQNSLSPRGGVGVVQQWHPPPEPAEYRQGQQTRLQLPGPRGFEREHETVQLPNGLMNRSSPRSSQPLQSAYPSTGETGARLREEEKRILSQHAQLQKVAEHPEQERELGGDIFESMGKRAPDGDRRRQYGHELQQQIEAQRFRKERERMENREAPRDPSSGYFIGRHDNPLLGGQAPRPQPRGRGSRSPSPEPQQRGHNTNVPSSSSAHPIRVDHRTSDPLPSLPPHQSTAGGHRRTDQFDEREHMASSLPYRSQSQSQHTLQPYGTNSGAPYGQTTVPPPSSLPRRHHHHTSAPHPHNHQLTEQPPSSHEDPRLRNETIRILENHTTTNVPNFSRPQQTITSPRHAHRMPIIAPGLSHTPQGHYLSNAPPQPDTLPPYQPDARSPAAGVHPAHRSWEDLRSDIRQSAAEVGKGPRNRSTELRSGPAADWGTAGGPGAGRASQVPPPPPGAVERGNFRSGDWGDGLFANFGEGARLKESRQEKHLTYQRQLEEQLRLKAERKAMEEDKERELERQEQARIRRDREQMAFEWRRGQHQDTRDRSPKHDVQIQTSRGNSFALQQQQQQQQQPGIQHESVSPSAFNQQHRMRSIDSEGDRLGGGRETMNRERRGHPLDKPPAGPAPFSGGWTHAVAKNRSKKKLIDIDAERAAAAARADRFVQRAPGGSAHDEALEALRRFDEAPVGVSMPRRRSLGSSSAENLDQSHSGGEGGEGDLKERGEGERESHERTREDIERESRPEEGERGKEGTAGVASWLGAPPPTEGPGFLQAVTGEGDRRLSVETSGVGGHSQVVHRQLPRDTRPTMASVGVDARRSTTSEEGAKLSPEALDREMHKLKVELQAQQEALRVQIGSMQAEAQRMQEERHRELESYFGQLRQTLAEEMRRAEMNFHDRAGALPAPENRQSGPGKSNVNVTILRSETGAGGGEWDSEEKTLRALDAEMEALLSGKEPPVGGGGTQGVHLRTTAGERETGRAGALLPPIREGPRGGRSDAGASPSGSGRDSHPLRPSSLPGESSHLLEEKRRLGLEELYLRNERKLHELDRLQRILQQNRSSQAHSHSNPLSPTSYLSAYNHPLGGGDSEDDEERFGTAAARRLIKEREEEGGGLPRSPESLFESPRLDPVSEHVFRRGRGSGYAAAEAKRREEEGSDLEDYSLSAKANLGGGSVETE
uniref:CCDC66 domain-containing protein n=1 Tax=Chromera velia CCMP2878 TaxID=1169474 RepID=A0A0G4HNS7_9ALVE|eukprot:Cvel_1210.t1-p1 / transcript=Cvel_1210.t1 / gene=Cvel_1210 / organism=Chromera_velia_CCMP2878 / gene_product=hypothetical protein / transcript_product=hypothetical protein / location=Cvel_scaffold40:86934-94146(-) / protein_length=1223 / sequence_SO=supercontig / SO=protein_coding / is_pseudo=false